MPTLKPVPDLMASMSSFSTLNEQALRQIRKTAENPPKVSVYDVISAITGQSNPRMIWDRLCTGFPEVVTYCDTFKFDGRGQQGTPVTDARGITEIIMVLPGKAASHFRKAAANVIVRYLGGDIGLVEEIAANRLLQENLPEDHPARIFGQTVEGKSEAIKRKEEELQLTQLDGRIKRARIESASEGVLLHFQTMKQLELPMDDRDKMRARDLMNTALHGKIEDTLQDKEICIRQFLNCAGIHKYGVESQLGKLAKRLYIQDHPAYTFPKKEIYANGQMCQANVWYESQADYLQRALQQLA